MGEEPTCRLDLIAESLGLPAVNNTGASGGHRCLNYTIGLMKRLNQSLIVGALIATTVVIGCASSGSSGRSSTANSYDSNKTVRVDNPSVPLDDYLRRIPGVQVNGSGPGATITVRGVNTFIGNVNPLFIVDGIRTGRNFSEVYNLLAMSSVDRISVLKGADAGIYGVEGANGVILITTKR